MNKLTTDCTMTCKRMHVIKGIFALFLLLIALNSYSQNKKVSINVRKVSVQKIADIIEKQTNLTFVYQENDVKDLSPITIKASNVDYQTILDEISRQTSLEYKISDHYIFLTPKEKRKGYIALQKNTIISGIVLDETGEPLIGVSIIDIASSDKGTITDIHGKFTLSISSLPSVLRFSYVGFKDKLVTVTSPTAISVSLEQDTKMLTGVTVTALGIKREEKALGYSVSKITGESLEKAKGVNVINALAGKVPGLVVEQTAGGAGGSSRVLLRGYTDMSGDNQPLYVIDGIPMDNSNFGQADMWGGYDLGDGISSLNPDDIENISVLKGPAASALYGSRASHGVILISTKKAKVNHNSLGIEFNSSTTIDQQSTNWDDIQYIYGQGYEGKITGIDERGSANNNWGPKIDAGLIIKQFDGISRPFVAIPNNMNGFFETGITTNNTLTFNSVNERNGIRISYNDVRNKDIVPNTGLTRNSISIAINSSINSKLKIEGRVNYIREKVKNRPAMGDDRTNIGRNLITLSNTFDQAWLKDSYMDDSGNYYDWNYRNMWNLNPYWIINAMKNESKKDRYISSATLSYQFTKNLNIRLTGGGDFNYFNFLDFAPISTPGKDNGYLQTREFNNKTFNLELLLSYTRKIKDIDLGARLGGNFYGENRQWVINNAREMISRNSPVALSSFSTSSTTREESITKKQIYSAFGMLNLGYKGYIYLDLTSRLDASSALVRPDKTFAPGNPYFYNSLSGSFVFSHFFNLDKDIIPYGKVRASWAKVGSDTDPYQLGLTYSYYPRSYAQYPMAYITNSIASNRNLKPTMTNSFETGFEIRFFKNNRLGIDFTYYSQESKDQILRSPTTIASGFSSAVINAGKITNKGIEISILTKPIITNNLIWDLNFNFSRNRNKVVELAEGQKLNELESARWADVMVAAQIGKNFGSIMGRDYLRTADGTILIDPTTGYPKFTDELMELGNASWDWTGGLYSSLSYKNFTLSIAIDTKVGADLFSMSARSMYQTGKDIHTLEGRDEWYRSEEERVAAGLSTQEWQPTGGYLAKGVIEIIDASGNKTYIKNNIYVDPAKYWDYVSQKTPIPFIFDNTYIKVRELTLTYNLPKSWISKIAQSASVSFIARNPFIIYKNVPNIDPESTYNNSFGMGLEYGSLPQKRSYGININLQF